MIWSAPTETEHNSVLKYIKRERRSDIIWCAVLAVFGAMFLAAGIYAVIDKFDHAAGFFVAAFFVFLVAGGFALSDLEKYKKIRNREYEVSRCRVISRSATRTKYSTNRKITVLILSDGKQSTYKVSSASYRKAREDAAALLVDYTKEHEGKRDIPIDVVIPEPVDE